MNNNSIEQQGSIKNSLHSIIVFVCIALFIYLRDPRYFTNPRFWAEEGAFHFVFSFSHPWYQALFQPQVGYLNFYANLATILATFVPLENAPLVTTLAAFLIQLIPFAIILSSSSSFWQGWWRKIIGCAVVLFVPLTNEGWLNTINSYTFLAVVAFLILLDDIPQSRVKRWIFRVLLIIAGLSGVLACSLTPVFFIIAWLDKSRERWIQMSILAMCSLIHLFIIFSLQGMGSFQQRSSWIGFSPLGVTFWTQSFVLFTTGYQNAKVTGKLFRDMFFNEPQLFMLWGRCLFVAIFALFYLITKNITARLKIIFLSGIFFFIVLSVLFSIQPEKYLFFRTGAFQRSFLPSNILLGWMLLANIRFEKGKGFSHWIAWGISFACVICLTLAISWGANHYITFQVPDTSWHDWHSEVAAWRVDPEYHLRIQPDPWVMELGKK